MSFISNDSSYWPTISLNIFLSYWEVAAVIVMVYDWVLTFGQEIELIWYLMLGFSVIHYIGIPYSVSSLTISVRLLENMPLVWLTDAGCGANVALSAMLGVITVIALNNVVLEELILSGTYMCGYVSEVNNQLISIIWTLYTVWEVLALCLSVWVAVKHFRELRRLSPSTGSTVGDCFRVLIQLHILYFASSAYVSFAGVSCLQLTAFSPEILNSNSIGVSILRGALQISLVMQMFVLGPRLILSVREYHAKVMEYSNAETSMISFVLQERVHVSTSSTV
ncbi:uncharacterized protein F5147DRAFT_807501 [Suillus discolor]|uniref:DUF6533 domain-containing protein n=1 Tax=Suillus discolor TaxID=1912936 RepID=A0A9P7JRZ2_9AGAM|nr:uncharacterized protein F5147DRAFT_807501 [Suillus discolor]KAG2104664.1 hypothetical protein F5147DRAFT_807501 [Suillus discolor]